MKKRLLALALCLVLVTSLLPITAAADNYNIKSVDRQASGVIFSEDLGCYCIKFEDIYIVCDSGELISTLYLASNACSIYTDKDCRFPCTEAPTDGTTLFTKDLVVFRTPISLEDDFQAKVLVPGYETEFLSSSYDSNSRLWINFSLTKKHEHDWQFTVSENHDTLTAKCRNNGCGQEVSMTLSASSVTLPTSPFNAQLAGEKEFQAAFPNAAISKIRYDYKGSDGVWHKGVADDPANAKAGEYQAFVQISNLPRPVESDGVVAMAENPDGTYTADLFVKYTAVDPAITAQTGDNRPIELMMGSVVLFSALAAAAFVLDGKRKYRQ